MIIEFASEVSNLAWRVSQSQNGGAIFARTKWSPMFGSVVFDYQWCILIVMSVKSSFYNEYDIKNNEKPVFWAQRSFQNHHQTFHDRCPEKIGPLPKKSDHWSTRTCPENIRPAPTWLRRSLATDINVDSRSRIGNGLQRGHGMRDGWTDLTAGCRGIMKYDVSLTHSSTHSCFSQC